MSSPWLEAALLGAVHGLSEFLPISSQGHVRLMRLLFGSAGDGRALSFCLRAGTWLSVLAISLPRMRRVLAASPGPEAPAVAGELEAFGRDLGIVLWASLPAAAFSLLLRKPALAFADSPLALGLGFGLTALVLASSVLAPLGLRDRPTQLGALLLGAAQGLAVLPGLSRSALTLTVLLLLGLRRPRAFELSLLVFVPTTLLMLLLDARDLRVPSDVLLPALTGGVVAFVVGSIALRALQVVVDAGRLAWFAAWLVPLSVSTLALAQAWPRR